MSAPVTPLLSTGTLAVPPDPQARHAALIASEEDHLRRSDSPVANSPSKHPGGLGSASVSSPVRIAPTPMPPAAPGPLQGRRDAVDAGAPLQQAAGPAAGAAKDGQQGPVDSITLGQLKGMTAAFPKPKQSVYTFPSPPPDTSDMLSELEEFYSYVEVPQVLDHKDSFLEAWPHRTEFIKTPKEQQLEYIQRLLDGLSSPDAELRFTNARHLLYIAQGTFQSSTSPEHHLHLILLNCTLLRSSNALVSLWSAIKATGVRWESVSAIPDPDIPYGSTASGGQGTEQERAERQELLDEVNGELALLLAVMYFMVEVFRGEEEWGQELMALDPPMPIYLFNLVAGLRERNAKGYPVKKLLLLLWKSLLSCVGGMKDVDRVKRLVREVEGLPPDSAREEERKARGGNLPNTKVAPPDLQHFRNEITSKYPSYAPPPIPLISDLDRISAAAAPAPVRPTFSYHINVNHDPTSAANNGGVGCQPPQQQPATPAPSPPPSPAPKPKKQQFQTDQTKPFVLPFAPSNAGPRGQPPRAVPASIDEAGELYRRNLRISNELWQTWKLREEFCADEGGLVKAERMELVAGGKVEPAKGKGKSKQGSGGSTASGALPAGGLRGFGSREDAAKLSRRMEALVIDAEEDGVESGSTDGEDGEEEEDEDPMDPLTMLRRMERKLKAEEDAETDTKKRKELAVRRVDVTRLERVEMLYRAILPQMQSAVIVLLKLLLATVTANSNANNNGGGQGNDSGNEEPVELSLEDTDINRHREITSKAVSAILILTLKWFKTSHVMKFHYLSQLLVDSNCLLLILKMFGLQEVSTSVKIKNERPSTNFFKYCQDAVNPSTSSPRPEDAMLSSPPPGTRPTSPAAGAGGANATANAPAGTADEDEVELITDYSWRNFFAVINFVHILQKLTKRKTHRVLLLVQYKSSAILKRILKVSHPTLQLYVLKVIKSQVPYCGRKWRQSNMKVITAIYLHCRPDLRDEWLTGIDVDADVEESLPHEQALRTLVRFFNTKHYGAYAPHLHRRSSSAGHAPPDFGGTGMPPPSPGRPNSAGGADDVFPPTRSVTSYENNGGASPGSYFRGGAHEVDDLNEYEVDDLLLYPRAQEGTGGTWGGLGGDDWESSKEDWERLGEMVGDYGDISDSESVGSLSGLLRGYGVLGGLDDDGSSDGSVSEFDIEEVGDEEKRRHEWEHISPDTITALEEERAAALPHSTSPRPSRRRSSTGPISPALRPVLIDRDDDAADALDEGQDGPVAAAPHSGPAVDEVELVFGE